MLAITHFLNQSLWPMDWILGSVRRGTYPFSSRLNPFKSRSRTFRSYAKGHTSLFALAGHCAKLRKEVSSASSRFDQKWVHRPLRPHITDTSLVLTGCISASARFQTTGGVIFEVQSTLREDWLSKQINTFISLHLTTAPVIAPVWQTVAYLPST